MPEYNLYCFAQSGNSYKAALMLTLAKADWQPRFVDFFNGETRTPAYRAINAMGEAPVLEHGDLKLAQSGVILDYLTNQLHQFGPRNEDERREILRWTLWDNHKLTSYFATYRFLKMFAGQGDSPQAQWLHGRLLAALKVLDTHLNDKAYAIGSRITIADLSMIGYMYFADEIALNWADYPHVKVWTERIAALPGWKHPYDLMPGHPLPAKV
jgi:glutathione S-transferase